MKEEGSQESSKAPKISHLKIIPIASDRAYAWFRVSGSFEWERVLKWGRTVYRWNTDQAYFWFQGKKIYLAVSEDGD